MTEEKASVSEGLTSKLLIFDNSPIPQEWKKRLKEKILECREVSSTNEFDVGCTLLE